METIIVTTAFEKDSNWVSGYITNETQIFKYWAKVYDEPSEYGIKNGRVSKLQINSINSDTSSKDVILNYDRGWDIKPTKETRPLLKAILNTFKIN